MIGVGLACAATAAVVLVLAVRPRPGRRVQRAELTTLGDLMGAAPAVDPPPDDYPTAPIRVLPPLPPALPRPVSAHDTDWLADQPFEVRLTATEVDLRCRDIESAEGWAVR
jgi:hypothetical protein